MKVEQLNPLQIDWKKPQVVVSETGTRVQICTNIKPDNTHCFSGMNLETGELLKVWDKEVFKPETSTDYPIELKITFETPQEICNLLHRCSLDGYKIDEMTNLSLKYNTDDSNICLYNLLGILAKERNLYKND